jgi:predicted Zn-dependent protease with MMP-like domain
VIDFITIEGVVTNPAGKFLGDTLVHEVGHWLGVSGRCD